MQKPKKVYLYTVVLIFVFLAAAGLLALYGMNIKETASAVASNQPNLPAQVQQSQPDVRTPACEDLAKKYPDQTDFLDSCMAYYSKFCFSDKDCGPFLCVSNKCQVE